MVGKKKILIITNGTRGDIDPFIGLAQGLIKHGHQPTICAPISFKKVITDHGIDYAYMNNGLPRIVKSEAGRSIMESSASVGRYVRSGLKAKSILEPSYRRQLDETLRAAQNLSPDMIIFNHVAIYGHHIARVLDIPSMAAVSSPILIPTGDIAHLLFPQLPWLKYFGRLYNRLTYHIFFKIVELVTNHLVRQWQKKHQLPHHSNKIDFYKKTMKNPLTVVHHYSTALSPRAKDWENNIVVSGYWFRQDKKTSWQPPKDLVDFIKGGTPPIYIGFGSMTGSRKTMKHLITTIGTALAATNMRAVIGVGWSKNDWQAMSASHAEIIDKIYYLDEAPHDWLFPQMAGVMHHGGAGTTAAGFRAMKPAIICPFFADQHFWARRVRATQSGVAMIPLQKINADNLAAAITKITTDKNIIANAKKIGNQINNEDGVDGAIKTIEKIIMSKRNQRAI